MADYLDPIRDDEPKYKTIEDIDNDIKSKREMIKHWEAQIKAADRVYKGWADRFHVDMLYQYYEGFQWFFQTDENNRPYVINMIYSTIETKLPNLIFDNPQFALRARPVGLEFNEELANERSQAKEDALNYVVARKEFSLSDKHELAALDAFFGFGVVEVDYSTELYMNPYIPEDAKPNVLDLVYCKQIPYDTFRVAATANWDLSTGKWFGYYEFIPWDRLAKFKDKLNYPDHPFTDADEIQTVDTTSGKITVAPDSSQAIPPEGHCKVWKIWDFNCMHFILYCPDDCKDGEGILEYRPFKDNPISILRNGKRRRGWYPYPVIWNWISPQDELNDTRQAQRLHRKRFTRKYLAMPNAFESEEELDKFIYGPDGTVVKVTRLDAIKAVEDAPLDPVAVGSLAITYDDFNRISGTPDESRGVPVSSNRTTATQAGIMDRRSQIRESKDSLRVGDFMCNIGRTILKALRLTKKDFWVKAKLPAENLVGEIKPANYKWKKIPPQMLRDDDYDVDLSVTSVSPISQQEDKQAFMEFLALTHQYELINFSPALLRETAYRVGYKNEAVLQQYQQLAQVMAIGRQIQAEQQVKSMVVPPPVPTGGPTPSAPGQLAQQQTDSSTPPDNQEIINKVFNRTGL